MVCNHNRAGNAICSHGSIPNCTQPEAKQLKELSTVQHRCQHSPGIAKAESWDVCVKALWAKRF